MSSAEKIQASVGILTFNSGKVIGRALDSVKDFDDIILCDGGSTDDTVEIARAYGARILSQDAKYKYPNGRLKDYGGVRNQCLDAAKHDCFLYIDSDETISDGLRDEIREISKQAPHEGEALVYNVPLIIMMDGRPILYSSNYPGWQHRFFKKRSGARFIKTVHERIAYDEAHIITANLTNPWHTQTTREDWVHHFASSKDYREIEVVLFCKNTWGWYFRYSLFRAICIFAGVTMRASRNYLVHGFKDTLPIQGEIGRACIPLSLALDVGMCKLGRIFSHS